MEKDSRLRIDKELGVIDKIVPKIMSDDSKDSKVVPYESENGDDLENDYNIKEIIFTTWLKKVQPQLMESLSLREKVSIQEHMRLLVN